MWVGRSNPNARQRPPIAHILGFTAPRPGYRRGWRETLCAPTRIRRGPLGDTTASERSTDHPSEDALTDYFIEDALDRLPV